MTSLTPNLTGWAAVSQYAGLAAKFQHASLACQVMAGFELLALHKASNIRGGGQIGNHNAAKNDSAIDAESFTKSWATIVNENAGISERTSRNWMAMAAAVAPRLRKLQGNDRLRELVNIPPNQWSTDDSHLMFQVTYKLTEGRTQLDFMEELGIAKKPQGSGATGGARPRGDRPLQTAEEEIAAAKKLTAERLESAFVTFENVGAEFTILDDFHIQAQIARLETYIAARKAWLAQPKTRRDPAPIAELLRLKS